MEEILGPCILFLLGGSQSEQESGWRNSHGEVEVQGTIQRETAVSLKPH